MPYAPYRAIRSMRSIPCHITLHTMPYVQTRNAMPYYAPCMRDARQAAEAEREEAQLALQGPGGYGTWRALHAALVGRRNRMVADLARAYEVGAGRAGRLWAGLGSQLSSYQCACVL